MADALGVSEQGVPEQGTSTDYLGVKSPTAFRGQPALPAGAGPIGTGAAPPATAGGKGPSGPLKPLESGPIGQSTFADLSSAVGGDAGSEGPGTPGVGQATDAAAGPGNIGLSFGFGPAALSIGPTGTISVGARGNSTTTQAFATALNTAVSALGVPTSVNLPSLIASLTSVPALGIAAQLAGAFGIPFTLTSLAHAIASMSPTSVTSLQAALADPNPESQLTAAQALAIAAKGQMGPTTGGPQGIGNLSIDNALTGPQGSAFGLGATNPSIAGQNQFASEMTLADMAAAIFGTPATGRTDTGPPSTTAPPDEGISAADAVGGNPDGPPGDSGSTSGGTDAGEA